VEKLVELAEKGGPFVAVFLLFAIIWLWRRYDKLLDRNEKREDIVLTALRDNTEALREWSSIFKASPRRPRSHDRDA
jgi:hypothetical protein